ncbi:hypothetical protein DQ244_06120 [Blastococcus sp. TBT05-19]|uniref:hypothetical protein n=1 Tax=Blastococcus sp. TBT05-19 TaxID=2250581 RepID=UPI000DE91263|nr:hypothetical protein [Blastococcus sp. TBT05-19]RBY94834.1 hypothetical protein DQ244_06120 [Blastococcus sp. TBT05-19]
MYGIADHWGYGQIITAAWLRIDADRERGGAYAVHARLNEETLRTHKPATEQRGEPCTACGQEWPCAEFGNVFAPD